MIPYRIAEQFSGDRRGGSPGGPSRPQSRDQQESGVVSVALPAKDLRVGQVPHPKGVDSRSSPVSPGARGE